VRPGDLRRIPQGQCQASSAASTRRSKNIEAVEVATARSPIDRGRDRRAQAVHGADERHQSAAQRYFFFAERKAAKIEGLPEDTEAARPDQARRRDRRRHDGRRHLDELPPPASR
jgi:hypothetical protein